MLNIFNTIIEMNIKAAIVILLILMVRLFLKNAPKKFSYMLWAVAAFRLCVPYSFKTIFSVFNFVPKNCYGQLIALVIISHSGVQRGVICVGNDYVGPLPVSGIHGMGFFRDCQTGIWQHVPNLFVIVHSIGFFRLDPV